MFQTAAEQSSNRQCQTRLATNPETRCGRTVVGQAMRALIQVLFFVTSVSCLPVAFTTPVRADERQQANEITDSTSLRARSIPEATACAVDPSVLLSIDAQTDITVFLPSGVPDELRVAALRRAWIVNPAIRDFKEMAENDWDFNDLSSIPGFGEIGPDVDVAVMVAQILRRPPRLALVR